MSIQFQSQNFQHILRMCNTNVDGRQKVMYALTAIRGIGRRISNIVCKKCDIDLNKRAGELTTDEVRSAELGPGFISFAVYCMLWFFSIFLLLQ